MKNLLLLLVATFPCLLAISQEQKHELPKQTLCLSENHTAKQLILPESITSIFSEDFSSGCPPTDWTVVGDGQTNWESSSTNNAGGASPEGMFSWSPQFEGNSKLVSPEINTSGNENLVFEFKHMVNDYSGDYTLLVETTIDGNTWNEAWSIYVSDNIEAETVSFLIDNDDVGSENFQFAFTYDGDSYNVNYWYIDDVLLLEAYTLDVGMLTLIAPTLAAAGEAVEIAATVKNYGSQTVDFDVVLEVYESSSLVHTSTESISDLVSTEQTEVIFTDWTPGTGTYDLEVYTALTGDENPSNNSMSQGIQIIDDIVAKKPCFEEFTSSTCIPCAGANPIIDQVLYSNPGEYSLIKYQMDWPGAGDPYYTEQGGVRRDYYGVSAVPDLYCNADQISPAMSMSQEIFDQYSSQVTGLDIEVSAIIENESMVTVDVTINSFADYEAGLMTRIVVVEKTTFANISTNAEEEFHNVMMVMLPDADGTELEALSSGSQVDISESYDMTQTFMEQANDLAVIVFVQDETDKNIIQSEMVDITGTFVTYTVTFNVEDSDGNPVDDALINFDINGFKNTGSNGQAVFPEVFPGTFNYEVSKSGLLAASGTVEVVDENVTVDVVLQLPDYYFYEDFGNGMPSDWTIYTSSGNSNNLYWYDGFVVFWMQASNDLVIQLMTPEINLTQAGTLFFEAGDIYSTPEILVGTVTNPAEPDSFEEIASFTLTSTMDEYQVVLEDLTITESYLAFRYGGPPTGYFYFDNVKISVSTTALGAPANLTATVEDNDVLLYWDAPESKDLLGYNVFRDGENITYVTETEYTDLDLENGLYEYHVTAVYDDGESGSSNIATANVGNVLIYCNSEGGGGQYVSHVVFGDIDNTSGFEGYGNFTAMSTDIEQGGTYILDLTIASPSNGDDIGVWFDFNQDGELDEDENLYCEMDNEQGFFSWEITVPEDAVLGTTRMRIKDKYWEIGCDPCGYTTWGETEDYSVNIVEYIGVNEESISEIHLFPNPAKDIVYLNSESTLRNIQIFSSVGQLMLEKELSGNACPLNTSHFEPGIYLFRIRSDEGVFSERVMLR